MFRVIVPTRMYSFVRLCILDNTMDCGNRDDVG